MYACTIHKLPMYVQVQSLYLGTCHDLARFGHTPQTSPRPLEFLPPSPKNQFDARNTISYARSEISPLCYILKGQYCQD